MGFALNFPEDEIHDPATSHVRAFAPAMRKHVGVVATGLFQSIGQDGHPVKRLLLIDRGRYIDDRWGSQGIAKRRTSPHSVPEDAPKQVHLESSF
jgi:hypothetical protein